MDAFANFKFSRIACPPILGSNLIVAHGECCPGSGNPEEAGMHDREVHCKPVEELVTSYQTSLDRGLTTQEAQERLREFGANELAKEERSEEHTSELQSHHDLVCRLL